MFEKNKLLWFILVALFGSAVAILGAHELQKKMMAKKADRSRPDARQIIEELKQANVDPFRAMMERSEENGDARASVRPPATDAGSKKDEQQGIFETLGLDQVMQIFEEEKVDEN